MKHYFLLLLLLFSWCATFAQTKHDTVLVLPLHTAIPENAKKLGSIKAGNNATATQCDYEAILAAARDKAVELGGNVVVITNMIAPVFISKCYKITADVYKVAQLPQTDIILPKTDSATLPDTNHAKVYIFRLKDTIAFAPGYNVFMNDSTELCKMQSNSRYSMNIYNEGTYTFWAKKEKRTEIKINIRYGKQYYIRCGLKNGDMRLQPVLELIDQETGKKEYNWENKKKDMNVHYLYERHLMIE